MVFERELSIKEKKIIAKIIAFVQDKHNRCEGHDYSHILEVTRLSAMIGKRIKERADPFVTICGALLHDIGRINAPNGMFHGIDGGSRTEEFLESFIEDDYVIKQITKVVVRHTPTSMIPPQTANEKIVFDADTIERLALMGMIRGIMGKTGTMEFIIVNKIGKRLADYNKLYFAESKKIAKPLFEETKKFAQRLKIALDKRKREISEVTMGDINQPQIKIKSFMKKLDNLTG